MYIESETVELKQELNKNIKKEKTIDLVFQQSEGRVFTLPFVSSYQ